MNMYVKCRLWNELRSGCRLVTAGSLRGPRRVADRLPTTPPLDLMIVLTKLVSGRSGRRLVSDRLGTSRRFRRDLSATKLDAARFLALLKKRLRLIWWHRGPRLVADLSPGPLGNFVATSAIG